MAIDPITATLTAGTVVGNLLQGQAAKKQAQQMLALQKRMHDEQMRFAKAGRTDAYGNTVRYDDALARWFTDLTPMQKSLLKAGEHEQFLNLTEDAGRNRNARRRQAKIGESSAEDYNTQLAGFRYGPQKSEESIFNEISNLVARAKSAPNRERTNQTLRQGRPLVNTSDYGRQREDASTALATRKAALDEFIARNNARNSQYLPAMEFFRGGAGGGGNAPINTSNQSDRLGQTQDSMAQLIASVGNAGASNIQRAGEGLTKAVGSQFPSVGDSARLIAALRGVPARGGKAGVTPIASSTGFSNDLDLDSLLAGGIY